MNSIIQQLVLICEFDWLSVIPKADTVQQHWEILYHSGTFPKSNYRSQFPSLPIEFNGTLDLS